MVSVTDLTTSAAIWSRIGFKAFSISLLTLSLRSFSRASTERFRLSMLFWMAVTLPTTELYWSMVANVINAQSLVPESFSSTYDFRAPILPSNSVSLSFSVEMVWSILPRRPSSSALTDSNFDRISEPDVPRSSLKALILPSISSIDFLRSPADF